MTDAKSLPLLGRIAVQARLIGIDQLVEATTEQASRGDGTPLGEILVEKGWVDDRQLAALMQKQRQIVARHRAARSAPGTEPRSAPAPAAAPPAAPEPAARAPEPAAPGPAEDEPRAPAPTTTAPAAAAHTAPEPTPADRQALDALLREAVERGASDLHLHGGAALKHRRAGRLEDAGPAPDPEQAERWLLASLGERERAELLERGEIDFCYSLEGVGRFRTNLYRQQRGLDGVFRHIPAAAPSLSDLGLPESLTTHVKHHQGMVLVTGPTSCGKTSTLAALVDLINRERRDHILCVEDPIEFLHPSKSCVVNQRSVKRHTVSFARALRAALREDPDVIVIGELRDLETISLALTAAETGHFVLATLHTSGSIRTVNRLVGAFPSDQQEQVRSQIAESLKAVISQRLLPRADGNGRVPALEVLVVTRAVENLIRENKAYQIQSILQTGASQGMGLMDLSIRALLDSGAVTREEALRHCEDPKRLGAGG